MKSIKIIIPMFAFIFAIVSSFAVSSNLPVADQAWGKPALGSCEQGDIVEPESGLLSDCDGNQITCKVLVGNNEEVDAYPNSGVCGISSVYMYNE